MWQYFVNLNHIFGCHADASKTRWPAKVGLLWGSMYVYASFESMAI